MSAAECEQTGFQGRKQGLAVFVDKASQTASQEEPSHVRHKWKIVKGGEMPGSQTQGEKPGVSYVDLGHQVVADDDYDCSKSNPHTGGQFSEKGPYHHAETYAVKNTPLDQDMFVFCSAEIKPGRDACQHHAAEEHRKAPLEASAAQNNADPRKKDEEGSAVLLDCPEEIRPVDIPASEHLPEGEGMDKNNQKDGYASCAVQLGYSLFLKLIFHVLKI